MIYRVVAHSQRDDNDVQQICTALSKHNPRTLYSDDMRIRARERMEDELWAMVSRVTAVLHIVTRELVQCAIHCTRGVRCAGLGEQQGTVYPGCRVS